MTVVDNNQNSIRRRTFAWSVVVCAVAVVLIYGFRYAKRRARNELERTTAELRQRWFNRVKKDGDQIGRVMFDATILPMFAGDEECVSRIEQLSFDMATVSPELAAYVSQLENVQYIKFYDTRGTDHVLANARNLPIRTIFFFQADITPDSLRSLAAFPKLNAVYFQQPLRPDEVEILKSLPRTIMVHHGFPPQRESTSKNGGELADERESK